METLFMYLRQNSHRKSLVNLQRIYTSHMTFKFSINTMKGIPRKEHPNVIYSSVRSPLPSHPQAIKI